MANLLSASEISKSFSSRELFRCVTLHIEEQERLGIIGPNGSGKSTLLKILAGIESADEGEITVKRGLKICYVPQESTFPPEVAPIEAVVQSVGGDQIEAEVAASICTVEIGI